MHTETYKKSAIVVRDKVSSRGNRFSEALVVCDGDTFIVRKVTGHDKHHVVFNAKELIDKLESHLEEDKNAGRDCGESLASFSTLSFPVKGVPLIVIDHPPATEVMREECISTICR